MITQILLHNVARLVFLGASAMIALAFIEGTAQLFGTTLIARMYGPGRLLELAAALMVFVIVVLLREIRDALRARQT